MKVTQNHIRQIKRHFSANGSILLPLALKWRLFYTAIGTLALLILSGMASHRVYASSITLEVPEKLSLRAKPDGQFHSSETPAVVKITSDAIAGYTFTMSGTGGSNALINGDYNIPSITVPIESSAFKANAWGYQISKAGATAGTKFQPGPTSNTQIDTTIEANAEAVQYSFTLGVMVDGTIPAGTYSNTFTLMVTANPIPYTITYEENAESSVTEMPTQQSGSSPNGQVALSDKEPLRDEYKFIGWCDATPTKEDNVDICRNGDIYQANDNLTLKMSSNNITLHAMWVSNSQIMQNWEGCVDLIEDGKTTTTLVDERDMNPYKIVKFENKCWMTENLRLGGDKAMALTNDDTDLQTVDSFELPASAFQAFSCGDIPQMYLNTENKIFGGYYNWYTATAGDGLQKGPIGERSNSICPAGWRLPNRSEALRLAELYDFNTAQTSPLKFLLSGGFNGNGGNCWSQQCQQGYWWTSWADGIDGGYGLWLYNELFVFRDWGCGFAHSVRCVAR